jgi:F-type H+-transporting ATPase subunit gamma
VGKKAIALYKKKVAAATYEKTEQHYDNDLSIHYETLRHRAHPVEVVAEHMSMLLRVDYNEVLQMVTSIVERYQRAEIDSVYIVYNEFKSVISQRLVVEKLLPIRKLGAREITAAEEMTEEQKEAAARAAQSSGVSVFEPDDEAAESEAKKFGTAEVDYIYDQPPEQLFSNLMPQYVTTQIFHALLESVAAEHAARMTATDAATKNAEDLIDSLSLTMNRVRQAAITKEIIEIVSGAAAL